MSILKSNVANFSGGVETDDGRILYGLDAETYLKIKDKEDPEYEKEIRSWIESVLGEKLPSPDTHLCLKNGVILCRLINTLRPGAIRKYTTTGKFHALVEIENINFYLKACWQLGVPSTNVFIPSDLHQKRGMQSVLQNIAALRRVVGQGVTKTSTTSPQKETSMRPVSSKPPRKWTAIQTGRVVTVADIVDDTPRQSSTSVSHTTNNNVNTGTTSTATSLRPSVTNTESRALEEELKKLKELLDGEMKTKSSLQQELDQVKRDLSALKQTKESEDKKQKEIERTRLQSMPVPYKNTAQSSNAADIALLNKQLLDYQRTDKENKQKIQLLQDELKQLKRVTSPRNRSSTANPKFEEILEARDMELAKYKAEIEKLKHEVWQLQVKSNLDPALDELDKVQTRSQHSFKNHEEIYNKVLYIEQGMDQSLVDFFHDITDEILHNSPYVEFKDIETVRKLFEVDSGRRLFAYFVSSSLNKKKDTELSDNSFELLLYLINLCLNELHLNSGGDYISAKILLEKTALIYRENDEHRDYIQDFIKEHHIWSNLRFWEELFWDTLAKEGKKVFRAGKELDPQLLSPKQQIFVILQLQQMIERMWGWGKLPVPSIQLFVSNMGKQLGIDETVVSTLVVSG
jgi:hypothetical protein